MLKSEPYHVKGVSLSINLKVITPLNCIQQGMVKSVVIQNSD